MICFNLQILKLPPTMGMLQESPCSQSADARWADVESNYKYL